MLYENIPVQGIIVPQQVHQSTSYYEERPSVLFTTNGRAGIRILDILRGDFYLDNGMEVPNIARALRITIRMLVSIIFSVKCPVNDLTTCSGPVMRIGKSKMLSCTV